MSEAQAYPPVDRVLALATNTLGQRITFALLNNGYCAVLRDHEIVRSFPQEDPKAAAELFVSLANL